MANTGDLLVPADGSANADRAVAFAIGLLPPGGTLHLLNVRPPLSGAVTTFLKKGDVDTFHREEGEQALASAVKLAAAAGVAVETHISVGRPGEVAAEFARRCAVRMIVMGTRGHTGLTGVLLGSVAQDIVAHADVPVCLVK